MIKLKEPITNLMVEDVLTVGPKSSLQDVADIFDLKHIHHIPVVVEDKLVGLVSKSDFLFFRHKTENEAEKLQEIERLANTSVDRIMSKNVAQLAPSQTVEDALNVFSRNYFHALPIVEEKVLKGIVTPMDIMKYVFKHVAS